MDNSNQSFPILYTYSCHKKKDLTKRILGRKGFIQCILSGHIPSLREGRANSQVETRYTNHGGILLAVSLARSWSADFLIQLKDTCTGDGANHGGLGPSIPTEVTTVPHRHAYRPV